MNPLPEPPPAERILVIRLGAVGDVVRTLPAVSALRAGYPDAQLAWLLEPPSRSVVEGQPWVDEVIVFPRPILEAQRRAGRLLAMSAELRRFRAGLRRRRFDLVVDFHSILKSGLLSRATAAPRRVSYAPPFAREASWLFATDRARVEPRRCSRFERNAMLLRYLSVPDAAAARPLHVPDALRERMAKQLGSGPAPIAVHPGTSDGTPHKRWTAEGYGAVLRTLAERDAVPSIVTAGPARDDRLFADAVVAAARGGARPAPPTASLPELAALFSHCRVYLGSDTGPMHVASLVGTPVVQLLGPTDPVENTPYAGTPSQTVRVAVGCNPCRRGCAAATCMRVITPQQVLGAVRTLLATAPGGW